MSREKKRLWAIATVLLASLLCSVWLVNITIKAAKINATGPLSGKVIAIDPGHGGDDPGVRDKVNNIKEKDINLAVSTSLKELLTAAGASVTLIRDRDIDYILHWRIRGGQSRKQSDLSRRIEMAKNVEADILVSLHVNASPKKQYGGAEAFYFPPSTAGKLLAESIQKQLRLIPGMVKRIPKTGDYYLLHHSPMPAVIVEIGYLTNSTERAKLVTASYQQQLSQAIALGIIDFFREYPKTGSSPATGNQLESQSAFFRPLAAIVIDDIGIGSPDETRELLALNMPLALAILPGTPASETIARKAARHGHQVILHLPMEAMTGPPSWLGQGAITVGLSDMEIEHPNSFTALLPLHLYP